MSQVYHIRTINGSTPPIPTSLVVTKYALDKDSYRTASGDLKRNKIADKMKFELVFKMMTKTELQSLLTILNSDSFTVTYEDMITSSVLSGTFYHNDITISPYWIKSEDNTNVLYNEFSVNLIEY